MRNFFDCIKTRKEPNAPVETGIAAARAGHIGNLRTIAAVLPFGPRSENGMAISALSMPSSLDRCWSRSWIVRQKVKTDIRLN
jgi:hypothetical protein